MNWKHRSFIVIATVCGPLGPMMDIDMPDEPASPFPPEQRIIGGTTSVIAATTTTTTGAPWV